MAIVYRFEKPTKDHGSLGIFVAGLYLKSRSKHMRDMPLPVMDIPIHANRSSVMDVIGRADHYFAFSSLRQAKEVLGIDDLFIQQAKRHRVKIRAFHVEDGAVIHLNSQCLFRKDKAKVIAKVPLEKLTL